MKELANKASPTKCDKATCGAILKGSHMEMSFSINHIDFDSRASINLCQNALIDESPAYSLCLGEDLMLAEACTLSPVQTIIWEHGEKPPCIDTIKCLAEHAPYVFISVMQKKKKPKGTHPHPPPPQPLPTPPPPPSYYYQQQQQIQFEGR